MEKKIKKIIFTDGTEMEIEKLSVIEILPTDSSEQKFSKQQQWNQQFFDFYHKILSVLPSVLVKQYAIYNFDLKTEDEYQRSYSLNDFEHDEIVEHLNNSSKDVFVVQKTACDLVSRFISLAENATFTEMNGMVSEPLLDRTLKKLEELPKKHSSLFKRKTK